MEESSWVKQSGVYLDHPRIPGLCLASFLGFPASSPRVRGPRPSFLDKRTASWTSLTAARELLACLTDQVSAQLDQVALILDTCSLWDRLLTHTPSLSYLDYLR